MQLGGTFWAFVPAGLLTAMVGGLVTMAVIANDDPGFALERDYYAKAIGYDAEMAQRATNQQLGWHVEARCGAAEGEPCAELVASVNGPAGPVAGARVTVEALRNARAGRVLEAELRERAPGEYAATLAIDRGGIWEVRFTVDRDRDHFTESVRIEVPERAR